MTRVTSRWLPVWGTAIVLCVGLAREARAQVPTAAPGSAAPPLNGAPSADGAPATPPAANAAPSGAEPVVVPSTPLPLPPTTPPPPPKAAEGAMRVGGALRLGMILQDPDQPKKMTEVHLDKGSYSNAFELRLGGNVTDYFSWTANFNALLDGDGTGAAVVGQGAGATFANVSIMDLIAQFKAADGFQIWVGRLLVPSDRSNFSGPFFMSPWNYPGFYIRNAAPIGPIEGANGRNQGATVWGNLADDKFKYFAGVYGIDQGGPDNTSPPPGANPFYSARLSYTLQGSEPGYFGSSTYYGEKSLVTIGVGGQYQKDGSVNPTAATKPLPPKDTFIGMADVLAEENLPAAGTFTFEGQFYAFNSGYNFGNGQGLYSPKEAFYALVSYLSPDLAGGKLQPLVRWQQTIDPAWTIVDCALAYVMKEYDARLVLTYEHIDVGSDGGVANSLQLGIQLQK